MLSTLLALGVIDPEEASGQGPLCQTDYMLYSRGAPVPRKLSIMLYAGGGVTCACILWCCSCHQKGKVLNHEPFVAVKAGC